MVLHVYNPSTQEAGAGRSQSEGFKVTGQVEVVSTIKEELHVYFPGQV
jgi:hypothetical protein